MEKRPGGLLLFTRILFILPFIIGSIGFMAEGMQTLEALFNALLLYFLNYTDAASNTLIEIGRWTAPLVTASGILVAFTRYSRRIRAWFKSKFYNTIAIYAENEEEAKEISEHFSYPTVICNEELLPARRYLLYGSEEKNLDFYLKNQHKLKKYPVYLKCNTLRSQMLKDVNLHLISPEEVGARLFWKNANVYDRFLQSNGKLKICIIGFEEVGQALLIHGLQCNIFSSTQKIEYHIWGNGDSFSALHHELSHITDSIIFHNEEWYNSPEDLTSADYVILCDSAANLESLQNFLFALPAVRLFILTKDAASFILLEGYEHCKILDYESEALKAENLFDEATLLRAKGINLRYAHIYNNVDETDANLADEWLKLDSFTRASNISSADYHDIRLQMLKVWNIKDIHKLSLEQLETLAELEHIRWCNFHYLNNWSYGEAENGHAKNEDKHTHADLRPYAALTDAEKQKDRDTVCLLLNLS